MREWITLNTDSIDKTHRTKILIVHMLTAWDDIYQWKR